MSPSTHTQTHKVPVCPLAQNACQSMTSQGLTGQLTSLYTPLMRSVIHVYLINVHYCKFILASTLSAFQGNNINSLVTY